MRCKRKRFSISVKKGERRKKKGEEKKTKIGLKIGVRNRFKNKLE